MDWVTGRSLWELLGYAVVMYIITVLRLTVGSTRCRARSDLGYWIASFLKDSSMKWRTKMFLVLVNILLIFSICAIVVLCIRWRFR
jgi:hypothetical protein